MPPSLQLPSLLSFYFFPPFFLFPSFFPTVLSHLLFIPPTFSLLFHDSKILTSNTIKDYVSILKLGSLRVKKTITEIILSLAAIFLIFIRLKEYSKLNNGLRGGERETRNVIFHGYSLKNREDSKWEKNDYKPQLYIEA